MHFAIDKQESQKFLIATFDRKNYVYDDNSSFDEIKYWGFLCDICQDKQQRSSV